VLVAALGIAAAIPLLFAFYTHLAWEDFLITYRFSENLARGRGLVYNPGERVLGFTSVLNGLLPALFAWVLRARDYAGPLWLFRIVSLFGLVFGSASIACVFGREPGSSRTRILIGFLFPILAALEIKSTAYAMSGQEAGLVLGFLAPAFAIAFLDWTRHRALGGVLAAGLLYSRPDAGVYLAALALASIVFARGPRRQIVAAYAQSALICAVLYLPWFLFTWGYYGSPVPHTVIAKHNVESYAQDGFGITTPIVACINALPLALCRALSPIYDMINTGPGSWPTWVHDSEFSLGLVAVLYWLVPSRDRFGRMASLVACVLLAYLDYTTVASQYCPWYFPPLAFMCLVALASAVATLAEHCAGALLRRTCAAIGFAGLAFFVGFIFVCSLGPIRFRQVVINDGELKSIGLWLKANVPPGESVYLEPLGYIGYYSQCRMLDWPGLVSPSVVEARKKIPISRGASYTWVPVADALKPDWIVARDSEAVFLSQDDYLKHHYKVMAVFDGRKAIRLLGPVLAGAPGMNLSYPETIFEVFQRVTWQPSPN
jgi:hypothetical protein